MRNFTFIIYGCLIIGLFACNNSSHFAKRKYLPNFKTQKELKATTIAVNEPIDSVNTENNFIPVNKKENNTVSNYTSITFEKIASIKKVKKPAVAKKYPEYAALTLPIYSISIISDTTKVEDKYVNTEYNTKESNTFDKIIHTIGNLLLIGIVLYFPFLTPLIIKGIEGKSTRQKHARTMLQIFVFTVLAILAILLIIYIVIAYSFILSAGITAYEVHPLVYNIFLYLGLTVGLAFIFTSWYLGLKTIIKNWNAT